MFKLKKIKKKVNKEIKKQYEKFEDRFLGIENTLYQELEDRLASLEEKFDRLTELLEDKTLATAAASAEEKPAKKKNKKTTAKKEKDSSKKSKKKVVKVPKPRPLKTEVEKRIEMAARRDLSQIRGIGKKIAQQLRAEGINTFGQIAGLSSAEINELDAKIPGFAARYERYEWGKQAKDLQ